MQPGPTIIRKCSACGKLVRQFTLTSGNTIGARYWTDGKMEAPMMPDRPWFLKCPHCGVTFWIDELEEVGKVYPWKTEKNSSLEFNDSLSCLIPFIDEYIDFLASGNYDRRKERYLRFRLWWQANDRRRNVPNPESMCDPVEVRNLYGLIELLDENDENDHILKAEAFRELGLFDKARQLITAKFGENFSKSVSVIRQLIENHNSPVAEISRWQNLSDS